MTREEAIEMVRKSWPISRNIDLRKALEILIPELAESEDERIRKWILEYLYDGLRKTDEQFKEQFEVSIAWLEKQKEQEHICDSAQYEEGFKIGLEIGLRKQKEQKSRIDACGFPLRDKGESACSYLERCLSPDMRNIWYEACSEIKEKQKERKPISFNELCNPNDYEVVMEGDAISLKRKEQKPAEWGEEDEGELQNAIDALEFLGEKGVYKSASGYDAALQAASWLKSLRPSWKPSEEQMKIPRNVPPIEGVRKLF